MNRYFENKTHCYIIKIDAQGLLHHQAIADQDDMMILDEVFEKIRRNALATFASPVCVTDRSEEPTAGTARIRSEEPDPTKKGNAQIQDGQPPETPALTDLIEAGDAMSEEEIERIVMNFCAMPTEPDGDPDWNPAEVERSKAMLRYYRDHFSSAKAQPQLNKGPSTDQEIPDEDIGAIAVLAFQERLKMQYAGGVEAGAIVTANLALKMFIEKYRRPPGLSLDQIIKEAKDVYQHLTQENIDRAPYLLDPHHPDKFAADLRTRLSSLQPK